MTTESHTTNPSAEKIKELFDPLNYDLDMSVEAINNPFLVSLRAALMIANRPMTENVDTVISMDSNTMSDGENMLDEFVTRLIDAMEWLDAMRALLNIATARVMVASEVAEIRHHSWTADERTDWLIKTAKTWDISMDDLEARTRPMFAA